MKTPANDNLSEVPLLLFIARQFQALQGYWRNAAAFLLGVGATMALPPLYIIPFLFISLPGLVWMVQSAGRPRRAFLDGWCFGLGYYCFGLYWISNALLVDADKFGWMVPFAVAGLSTGFALYNGLVTLVLYRFRSLDALRFALMAAVLWTVGEWIRGHFLTGFPWNLLGYVWTVSDASMQSAAWFGAYGLTLLTVLFALLPVIYADKDAAWRSSGDRVLSLSILLLPMLLIAFGYGRLQHAENVEMPGVNLRVVQANIEQSLKWDPDKRIESIKKHLSLSHSTGFEKVTHVIWPESAMTTMFESGDVWAQQLAHAVPENGLLLTGVTRMEGEAGSPNFHLFNSMKALNKKAEVVLSYDKYKLVPFGEFVPLRKYLPLDKVTPGAYDFSSGPFPAAIGSAELPLVWPLICYEAIFPDLASSVHPAWILNITNDAWFGQSTGPYQHFAMARMRAVEHGVALVRAANTGISAVVDPYGRVLQQLPLGVTGVIDSKLPASLPHATLYDRFGEYILLLLLYILGLCVLIKPHKPV